MATTRDMNRDPITGAPGAHPVGTGLGAAGGAAAGAAVGSVGGPLGAMVGGVVGAVAGGLAGKGVAEAIDPTAEQTYWRDNYRSRPYYDSRTTYDDWGPAYAFGVDAYTRRNGRSFDELESGLSQDWARARGRSTLGWEQAKHATRDAWTRVSDTVERATPGDSDRDGK